MKIWFHSILGDFSLRTCQEKTPQKEKKCMSECHSFCLISQYTAYKTLYQKFKSGGIVELLRGLSGQVRWSINTEDRDPIGLQ